MKYINEFIYFLILTIGVALGIIMPLFMFIWGITSYNMPLVIVSIIIFMVSLIILTIVRDVEIKRSLE